MKIRSGFVSNSSSSSFLISFPAGTNIEKLFKNRDGQYRYGDETHINYSGHEGILEWIKNNRSDLDYDYSSDQYDGWKEYRDKEAHRFMVMARDIAKEIKNGRDVAVINIDYNDTDSYENLNKNEIKILKDWS